MNRVFQVTGFAACCLALLLASSGHWLVLQSVAWTRMLIDYSRTDSLARAVGKTFDGKHPCCMCRAIQEGRKQEQERSLPIQWVKQPDLLLDARGVTVPSRPDSAREAGADFVRLLEDFIAAPPKPPPRPTG